MSYCEYRFLTSERSLIRRFFPLFELLSGPERGGEFYCAQYGMPDHTFVPQLNKLCNHLDVDRPRDFDVYVDMKAEVICAKSMNPTINIWSYYCTLKKELSK